MTVHVIVAFAIALLSGLGVGGGGLFAVYLSIFSDLPQLAVQGTNLLFFLFSSGASVTVNLFRRRILFSAVAIMIATGLAGAAIGVGSGLLFTTPFAKKHNAMLMPTITADGGCGVYFSMSL